MFDEPSDAHLGTPFFVMRRIKGLVPPDVMPYPMGSWVTEATDEQRRKMERSAVEVLAGVHGATDDPDDWKFLEFTQSGDTALRRHVAHEREYYEWARDGLRFPLLERSFDWLDDNWPVAADAAPPVLSWGDSRIGNMMFRDFEPVAVLDWEMAGVAPRELDVGWMIFLHRFFQDLCFDMGLPGLPEMFKPENVAAHYAAVSGHEPLDLELVHRLRRAAPRHRDDSRDPAGRPLRRPGDARRPRRPRHAPPVAAGDARRHLLD